MSDKTHGRPSANCRLASSILTWQGQMSRCRRCHVHTCGVTEWIYFIHPPRDDFAATMTAEEETVWAEHFQRLQRLLADGQLILAGPTLGTANTGLVIFDAPDEQAARQVMEEDPVVRGGHA